MIAGGCVYLDEMVHSILLSVLLVHTQEVYKNWGCVLINNEREKLLELVADKPPRERDLDFSVQHLVYSLKLFSQMNDCSSRCISGHHSSVLYRYLTSLIQLMTSVFFLIDTMLLSAEPSVVAATLKAAVITLVGQIYRPAFLSLFAVIYASSSCGISPYHPRIKIHMWKVTVCLRSHQSRAPGRRWTGGGEAGLVKPEAFTTSHKRLGPTSRREQLQPCCLGRTSSAGLRAISLESAVC